MCYWNNFKDVYKKYWILECIYVEYFMLIYGDNYFNGLVLFISDLVERGDYLCLKNVLLGYIFNIKNWLKVVGIFVFCFYVQVQNLFVIIGYSGMDLEILINVESVILLGGMDKNMLFQVCMYIIGVNLIF